MTKKTTRGMALERPAEKKEASKPTKAPREEAARVAPAAVTGDVGEMRLNITLPKDLHWAIRRRAAERQQTIRAYIIDLVTKDGVRP